MIEKEKEQPVATPLKNLLNIDGKEVEISDRAWQELMVEIALAADEKANDIGF